MKNKYPYTDFHELNADWLLTTVKEAADEANSMDDRVTSLESDVVTINSDLSPIKAAMPGIASDISDLKHSTGIMSALVTDTIQPAVETLQTEVEASGTGLLDRVTALENTPTPVGGDAVLYLEFDSSLIGIDDASAWDSRIAYDYLKNFIPLNTSGEESEVVKLYDSNTNRVFTLNQFHKQDSANPNGGLTFTCRVPYYSGGDLKYYSNYGVVVAQSGTYPTYSETKEYPLPEVSVSDAGSFLAVDENGEWGLDTPSIPEVESGTIPYTHANITADAYWYRIGEVITVTTLFHADYTGLSGTLFTLPYLPKAGFGTFFRCSGSNADLQVWMSGSNGDVSISTTTTAPNNYGLSFSYVRA